MDREEQTMAAPKTSLRLKDCEAGWLAAGLMSYAEVAFARFSFAREIGSPTRIMPSLRIDALSPPLWTSARQMPGTPDRFSICMQGSKSRKPRMTTPPMVKSLLRSWTSGTPRVTILRRICPATSSVFNSAAAALTVSCSINVTALSGLATDYQEE